MLLARRHDKRSGCCCLFVSRSLIDGQQMRVCVRCAQRQRARASRRLPMAPPPPPSSPPPHTCSDFCGSCRGREVLVACLDDVRLSGGGDDDDMDRRDDTRNSLLPYYYAANSLPFLRPLLS